MTEQQMWDLYIRNNRIKNKTYEAWSFGGEPGVSDKLAKLVRNNQKTATSSIYKAYEMQNSPLPQVNSLNIILDSYDKAVCLIQITEVYTCPFIEVSKEHAFKEGEGDRSLSYWRKTHENFFSQELKSYEIDFDERILIVCEEFKVIFK